MMILMIYSSTALKVSISDALFLDSTFVHCDTHSI